MLDVMLAAFRRIGTKILNAIDSLLEFLDWMFGDGLTRKDVERLTARPGAPGYLPPRKNDARWYE